MRVARKPVGQVKHRGWGVDDWREAMKSHLSRQFHVFDCALIEVHFDDQIGF